MITRWILPLLDNTYCSSAEPSLPINCQFRNNFIHCVNHDGGFLELPDSKASFYGVSQKYCFITDCLSSNLVRHFCFFFKLLFEYLATLIDVRKVSLVRELEENRSKIWAIGRQVTLSQLPRKKRSLNVLIVFETKITFLKSSASFYIPQRHRSAGRLWYWYYHWLAVSVPTCLKCLAAPYDITGSTCRISL